MDDPDCKTRPRIPPRETGDRLSRDEFERRDPAMSALKKAELIDGVVYVPSPTRRDVHGGPYQVLGMWLGLYQGDTPSRRAGDGVTLRLDMENEPQHDLTLHPEAQSSGMARPLVTMGVGRPKPSGMVTCS